jgi:3,4-dihydroxy 2-butanone 4-phosphate synthase/GTP cyclohydrolase II
MIREAPGRPTLVLGDDRVRALGLGTFVATNVAMPQHLEMIDARQGVTTGVSVADVVRTVRVATNPSSGASDIVLPGHVPVARVAPGGVFERLGASEAAFELTRLAGFAGGVVMCPLMADDGDLAAPGDLHRWVEKYETTVVSTTDTLDARLSAEGLLSIEEETRLQLDGVSARAVTFVDLDASARHYAVLVGGTSGRPVSLNVVEQDPLVDVFDRSRSPVEQGLAALRDRDDAVLCYVAPTVSPASDGSRAEEHRRSLLSAKRQSHVVSHMLSLLEIGAVVDQREGDTDVTR